MSSNLEKISKESNIGTIIQLLDEYIEEHPEHRTRRISDIDCNVTTALLSNEFLTSNQQALIYILEYLVNTYQYNMKNKGKYLLTKACQQRLMELISYLTQTNYVDYVEWYKDCYADWYKNLNLPKVLEIFVANGVKLDFMNNGLLANEYTEKKVMKIIDILIDNKYVIHEDLIINIVRRNMINVVEYIFQLQTPTDLFKTNELILEAMRTGNAFMIQLMLTHGASIPWSEIKSEAEHITPLIHMLTQLGCTTEQIVAAVLYSNGNKFALLPERHQPSSSMYSHRYSN